MYGNSEEFEVKFEVHQGLVLSLLLFDGGVDPRGQRWAAVGAVVQYQYVNNLVLSWLRAGLSKSPALRPRGGGGFLRFCF